MHSSECDQKTKSLYNAVRAVVMGGIFSQFGRSALIRSEAVVEWTFLASFWLDQRPISDCYIGSDVARHSNELSVEYFHTWIAVSHYTSVSCARLPGSFRVFSMHKIAHGF